MHAKLGRLAALAFSLALAVCLLVSCGAQQVDSPESLDEFDPKALGVIAGTSHAPKLEELYPNADLKPFDALSDMLLSMEQGKIDGFVEDAPFVTSMRWEDVDVKAFELSGLPTSMGFMFANNQESVALRSCVNAFIVQAKKDGTLDWLQAKWFTSSNEPAVPSGASRQAAGNDIIEVAVASDALPLAYGKEDLPAGYEVDVLIQFAKVYGYGLHFNLMPTESVIPSLESGRCDIACAGAAIEEGVSTVLFSDAHVETHAVMVVPGNTAGGGLAVGVSDDAKEIFVHDGRWKMILEGIGVTVLIGLSSAVLGTVLGFGLYLLTRTRKASVARAARLFAGVYERIVEGTPEVVILMVLFYVVFGGVAVSGVVVSIICFALTFGAFVYSCLKTCVAGVNRGHIEAAYALGYSRNKAFFRIILPQVVGVFLPLWCGEVVSLFKGTSVVGFIAVMDLTKVGDIIRNSTYDAVAPLLFVAVVYFAMTWILSSSLKVLQRRLDLRNRTREQVLRKVGGK